jgi:hypothetical protein
VWKMLGARAVILVSGRDSTSLSCAEVGLVLRGNSKGRFKKFSDGEVLFGAEHYKLRGEINLHPDRHRPIPQISLTVSRSSADEEFNEERSEFKQSKDLSTVWPSA